MRWIVSLALAAAVSMGMATEASAQFTRDRGAEDRPPSAEAVQELARAAVAGAALDCAVTESRFGGRGRITNPETGQPVTVNALEVRCEQGTGYVLLAGEGFNQAQTCLVAGVARDQALAAGQPEPQYCQLPSNADQLGLVRPLVAASGFQCEVQDLALILVTSTGLSRYEVACAGADGLWLDAATGSSTPENVYTCIQIANSGESCRLTDVNEQRGWLTGLSAANGRTCEATGHRFVGNTATSRFYEVACADGTGFMLRTTSVNQFEAVIECAQAIRIGNGCSLTTVDSAAVEAANATRFRDMLTAAGIACDYRAVGNALRETGGAQRTVVEFQCADRPLGLVVAFGAEGGTTEALDCIASDTRFGRCALVSREVLTQRLTEMLRTRDSGCNVTEFKVLGRTNDGSAQIIEVSCVGQQGLIGEFNSDRRTVGTLQTCAQARQVGDECTLPEG